MRAFALYCLHGRLSAKHPWISTVDCLSAVCQVPSLSITKARKETAVERGQNICLAVS